MSLTRAPFDPIFPIGPGKPYKTQTMQYFMPADWTNNNFVPTEFESQNKDFHFMEAKRVLQICSSANHLGV